MNIDDVIRTERADLGFLEDWRQASTDYHYQPFGAYLVMVRDRLIEHLESGHTVTFETANGDVEITGAEALRTWMREHMDPEYRDRY